MFCALSQFLEGKNLQLGNAVDTSDGDEEIEEEEGMTKINRRHLPIASGGHSVGCVDLMCDLSDKGTFFRLYYPTIKANLQERYKQWPLWLPRKQYAHGYVHFLKRNKKIFNRIFNWIGGDVYVPVLWQAPLIRSDEKFPVLIVSHGIGGNRTTLSTYCNELASHGFVVASLEHRDGTASMTLCLEEQLEPIIRVCDEHHQHHHLQNANHHPYNNNNDAKKNDLNKSKDEKSCNKENQPEAGGGKDQFYLSDGEESKEEEEEEIGKVKKESWRGYNTVKPKRQNRKRSLRHNHSCSETWRPFQHVPVWDDFGYRNKQMYHRAEEISDVLDELINMNNGSHINNALGLAFQTSQFKNRLDLTRVAVIGHSFGAAASLATLTTDDRFKVGISLDGWFHALDENVYKQTKQPALILNMEQFQWERNVNQQIRFQHGNSDADRPMITLLGGCHQSMTDFQFCLPKTVGRFVDVCGALGPEESMATCVATSLAFLHKHLDMPLEPKHKDILECKHPHLLSGTNVDLTIPNTGPVPP